MFLQSSCKWCYKFRFDFKFVTSFTWRLYKHETLSCKFYSFHFSQYLRYIIICSIYILSTLVKIQSLAKEYIDRESCQILQSAKIPQKEDEHNIYIYIYIYHENNVPFWLSSQCLCGNSCTWAHMENIFWSSPLPLHRLSSLTKNFLVNFRKN